MHPRRPRPTAPMAESTSSPGASERRGLVYVLAATAIAGAIGYLVLGRPKAGSK